MFASKLVFTSFYWAVLINSIVAENVLFLTGLPSPSHHFWNRAIVNGLAERGHNLTVLSVDVDTKITTNVHYILMERVYSTVFSEADQREVFEHTQKHSSMWSQIVHYYALLERLCDGMVQTQGFQQLLDYPADFRFDIVLYDYTCGPCLLPFLHKFNYPPLVAVTAFNNPPSTQDVVGGHLYYAYNPYYSLYLDANMNFWQRGYNMFVHTLDYLYKQHILIPKLNAMVLPRFTSNIPSTAELEQRATLALVSTNPALDVPLPLAPNVIAVGGLHIEETKRLPDEYESFIGAAVKGVVLFSLGTNVLSDKMDADKMQYLLDAFQQLPDYHFLWKFESVIETPKNVMLRPWMPQSDILAHPKVMAFITHAGLLSTQEAIWHGVPMIGIPFIYDQHQNIHKCQLKGIAEKIDYPTMTTDEIVAKLRKVLETPTYREKVTEMSRNFRDQKEKPLERAIWWIEWAIRHPNADYIKSPTLKHGLIASNSFDLIAMLTVAVMLIVWAIWKCLMALWRLLIVPPTNVRLQKRKRQ